MRRRRVCSGSKDRVRVQCWARRGSGFRRRGFVGVINNFVLLISSHRSERRRPCPKRVMARNGMLHDGEPGGRLHTAAYDMNYADDSR